MDNILKRKKETKDLKYYINILDKAGAGFEWTDSNLESSTVTTQWVKCYQTAASTSRVYFTEGSDDG